MLYLLLQQRFKEHKMTDRDALKQAQSMFNYSAQLVRVITMKHGAPCEEYYQELDLRWKPAYERALAFRDEHGFSKHEVR